MKNLFILVLCLIGSLPRVCANPLIAPGNPLISEIYFDENDNWFIEFNTFNFDMSLHTFDGISLETSSGTAFFKSGIMLTDSTVIITKDSMQNILVINPNADFIRIIGAEGMDLGNWYESELIFFYGNYEFSHVGDIQANQSYCLYYDEQFSVIAKCNTPTLGLDNTSYNCSENLTIIVRDQFGIPVTNIRCFITQYAYNYETHELFDIDDYDVYLFNTKSNNTDEEGSIYFSGYNLCAMNSQLIFKTIDNNYLYDTIVNIAIEPSMENIYEITLGCDMIFVNSDQINDEDYHMKVFPNPASDEVKICIQQDANIKNGNSVIKIFTELGDLLEIIPLNKTDLESEMYLNLNTIGYPSGSYYCNLEIDGQKVSTAKMMIIK